MCIGMAQRNSISTTRALYKYLMRQTEKLPSDAKKFYKTSIRHGYEQHVDETDSERIQQIIERSIQDAEWIVNKYAKKSSQT